MISCEKASVVCDKSQYKEATFIEEIKLFIHLLICRVCIKFSCKNTKLTSLCNRASLYSLSEKEKIKSFWRLNNI